mmetsp:Transcript_23130/g.33581  ORF Transcript_23130/g.33581 Transcript_23130/m.33581 type:complete len:259 (-) Transcript_23130:565-1341(-)
MKYGDVLKKSTSRRKSEVYLLPGSVNHLICRSALARIIGWGRYQWNGIRQRLRKNLTVPIHGSVGKKSNNSRYKVERDIRMRAFFDKIEALYSPRATQIVRDVAREGGKEEDEELTELTELPSHVSKRGLYKNFVAEHGWKYHSTSSGQVSLTRMEGVEQNNVPSHWTFLDFWDKNYPNMVITNPHTKNKASKKRRRDRTKVATGEDRSKKVNENAKASKKQRCDQTVTKEPDERGGEDYICTDFYSAWQDVLSGKEK